MLVDLDCIHTKFQKACQVLKLKEPILRFEYERKHSSRYEELNNEIIINLNGINELRIIVLPFIEIKLEKDIDIIMFSLYHELAHCLQWTKFSKWFTCYCIEIKRLELDIISEKNMIGMYRKYRELKIEKCADKIACILFEKLERKNE